MLRTEWHVSPAVELQQQLRHLPVAAALQLSVTARQLESQDQFLVLALGSDNLLEVRVPELLEAVPCCMAACPVMLHAVHLASPIAPITSEYMYQGWDGTYLTLVLRKPTGFLPQCCCVSQPQARPPPPLCLSPTAAGCYAGLGAAADWPADAAPSSRPGFR